MKNIWKTAPHTPKVEENSIPVSWEEFAALQRATAVLDGEIILLAVRGRSHEGDEVPINVIAPLTSAAQEFYRTVSVIPTLVTLLKERGYESLDEHQKSLEQVAKRTKGSAPIPLLMIFLLVVALDSLCDEIKALLLAFDVQPESK